MSSTTNIFDLPTDPVGGGSSSGNVSFVANETTTQSPTMSLDQTTINQIVSGLQQASGSGATTLQSRDIPTNTDNIVMDAYQQPQYIPPSPVNNYIENEPEIFEDTGAKMQSSLDNIYDEIQLPILMSILYFIFQLPIFKKYLFLYLPFLCSKDGNFNINGYFITSMLFGFVFYLLNKGMSYFSKF